jgi:negative regulator of flagellin synthesis FlgM
MKIQDAMQSLQQVLGKSFAPGVTKAARDGSTPQSVQGPQVLGADHAHVSKAASLLAKAATASDVRMEKVASIQTALANGSYKVSASDVASSLIDSMKKDS